MLTKYLSRQLIIQKKRKLEKIKKLKTIFADFVLSSKNVFVLNQLIFKKL